MACSFPRLSASNNHSPQNARQFSSIAEYMDEIHLLSGSENIVAGCFSRPSVDTSEQSQNVSGVYINNVFDLPQLAKRQKTDFLTRMTIEYLNGVQEVIIGNEKLLHDKSVVPRTVLPPDCCFPIFNQFHDLCHPE